jgi:predicted nucleotidyltransferase
MVGTTVSHYNIIEHLAFDIVLHRTYLCLEFSSMLTLQQILNILSTHRATLAQRYGIRRIAVFGSYVRQEQTPQSDVDVLVEFERPLGLAFVDLADELETILGTRVDLVSRGALNQRGYESIAADMRYV